MPVTSVSYSVDGWGRGEVWLQGTKLAWHELPHPPIDRRARASTPTRSKGGGEHPPPSRSTVAAERARMVNARGAIAEKLIDRFKEYFAGERVSFDDVPLELDGWTSFQLDVVQALRRVPYGDAVSYSELARLAGHPRAQRAAGTVLREQPLRARRPVPPRRRRRRPRLVPLTRPRLQAASPRPRGCHSLTIYATSSRRSRRGARATGSPSYRGSFTPRAASI